MKSIMKTVAAAAVLGLCALPAHAQDDDVIKLGTMSWEDIVPITGVLEHVLEERGFTVEVTDFAEWGIAYAALTRGDVELLVSEIDYVAHDYWIRNMSRLEKISIVSHGLFQAFAVPSYVPIDSVEELNANVDMFGGEIIGIEPGAGLMRESADAIETYGLDYELIEGSTAGMTAALKSAVDRQEPIVVTLWDPTWMFLKFDMKFLDDPEGVFSPRQAFNLIAQEGFSAEHPEARELLAGVFVPVDDIRAINAAVSDGQTMDASIQAWIDANGDLLDRWQQIKDY